MEQHGDRRSVLLVEDEVLTRLSIADELRLAGITVLEAANADEASTVLSTHADWVGVVLTDIQMPGSMDGLALVKHVRNRYPDVKVVVLSAARLEALGNIEADAMFSKPHSPALLISQLRQFLEGRAGNGSRSSHAGNS
jgi:CheY-like chemotaxis protein